MDKTAIDVKILVIDDHADNCVKALGKTRLLTDFSIEPWSYLCDADAIINDYNQNPDSFHDVVYNKLCETLNKEKETTRWLILLDFQLHGINPQIEDAIHKGILKALTPRENVYLILYTAIAPEALSTIYDKYEQSPQKKMHLYRRALHLCFFTEPRNYYLYTENVFKKQCDNIKGGNIDGRHWV